MDANAIARRRSISDALLGWVDRHALVYGDRSNAAIFVQGDYGSHDARNVRWLCECLMPMHCGLVNDDRTVWTLPNGARLRLSYVTSDDLADLGGEDLTMVIIVNASDWSPEILTTLGGFLYSPHGVPTRFVTTGETR
jgi:hypothetical protein